MARKPIPRHEARRRALELLYEADLRRHDAVAVLERAAVDRDADPIDDFTATLVRGVGDHLADLDAIIGRYAKGWTIARMPVVDRNLLRLGVYELLVSHDAPAAVVIDEMVELAKDLSTDDSPRYVNGVLSAVLRGEREHAG